MPGNVQLADPDSVLPLSLCSAFTEDRSLVVRQNDYPDGRSTRAVHITQGDDITDVVSRKSWTLSKRLTQTPFATLLAHWNLVRGPLNAFYWYPDPADYDATGVSATGRFIVRYDGSLSRAMGMSRDDIQLRLVQID